MESKIQGELAELLFQAECLKHNLVIAKPYGDSTAYDFIVDTGENLVKIQVKSTNKKDQGSYRIMACKGSAVKTKYTSKEVDLFAFYVAPEDAWYLIPPKAIKNKKATLNKKFNKYRNNWSYLK